MTIVVKGIHKGSGETVEVEWNDLKDFAGVAKKVSFDFAFDTPNLNQGVPVYTPEEGDVLYDLWFDVLTPFNGNPYADVTVDSPDGVGLYANGSGSYKLWGKNPICGLSNDARNFQTSLQNNSEKGLVPSTFLTKDPLKLYVTLDELCDGNGSQIDSSVGKAKLVMLVIPVS
jgi:hypothetical protein